MAKHTIDVGRRYGIGPLGEIGGHPAVTTFNLSDDEGMPDQQFLACLYCGYVTNDSREFHHTDCDPLGFPENDAPINRPWNEEIRKNGFPDHPHLG